MAADTDTTDHTQLSNIGTNTHAQLDIHVASTSNPHNTTKAQVGLANVENTADSSKPVSTATQAALDAKAATAHTHTASQVTDFTTAADARITSQKGQSSGLASLDSAGKVPSAQLPAIALTDVSVVSSQTAQLALTAQEGDVAVRSDLNKSYVHNGGSTGTMADWTELATPTDAVQSVNGKTGSVTLTTSDVIEGTNAYYTESRVSANTDVAANTTARHTHTNKATIDATTASFTTAKDTKLNGIATGAEVNVSPDWSAVSGDAQILNKPTLGTAAAANTSAFATATQGAKADSAVQSVVAGTNVTVNNADPRNPVISAAGSGGTNITNLTTTQAATTVTINSDTGSDAIIPTADATNAGVMSAAQQTKLAGIATAATANDTDANLKARANHTGTQLTSTISDFSTAADARITAAAGTSVASLTSGKVPTSQLPAVSLTSVQSAASQAAMLALTTQEGDVVVRTDTNQTYMRNAGTAGTMADFTLLNTPTDAVTSVNSQTGAVFLGKTDVGLGNVDNTSNTTERAATATLTNKTMSGASNTFLNIPGSAVTSLTTDLAAKVSTTTTVNTKPLSANVTLTQDDIGDGTTNKAYPTTDKTKLAGIAPNATANSTDATLLNRANHTGTQAESTITNLTTDLAAKAPLASPALTGTPTAPTATVGANTTQVATTAFVLANGTGGASTTITHPQEAVINTKTSYLLDGFNIHSERWVHSSGGSNTIADGVMTLTTPASNDSIVTRSLWTAILQDFDTITLDVNFNGNTLLTASDTPLLSFDQAGDRGIVLTNFSTNGVNGWQTITLPLSKFTSAFDATSSTAGTGTHLDPATTVSNLKLRVYENTAGKTLSFRRIIVSDSLGTLKQDFTQPTLFAGSKPGSSFWRIQSLDIMKVTKDNMQAQSTDTYMANLMAAVKPFNPTHMAVSTPYDDPSVYPTTPPTAGYALRWATAIRTAGRNIFWRQMPLEWEGIYSKTKNTSRGIGTASGVLNGTETTTYLAQIYAYIQANASQYRAGDIICPISEPENGGINGVVGGSSGGQFADANVYRRWLRDAITVTNAALDKINLRGQIAVGFYGTSGFIVFGNVGNPKGFLDERTLDAMSVLGMDDYPSPYSNMGSDLTSFETLYGQFPLMLTEWGTINETTDANRLTAMQSVLDACKAKPYFYGFNYWTTVGGSGNANENILDATTLAPIGGYANLLKAYTSGAPQTVATHLATLTGGTVQINTASPPSSRQALIADSSAVARF